MEYQKLILHLESLGVMPDRPPSLEPMQEILRRLKLGFPAERVIIVAGTNGKGSTCAALEALLLSAGQRVGLYTSPHLINTTERIRVDGRDISQEDFCARHEELQAFCRGLRLTHFETLTAMAYLHFVRSSCDWLILEVGLGGIWDATNAIPHRWCAITRLGLDHQNLLGSTLLEIAQNKFGVISNRSIVVHSPLPKECAALLQETLERTQSQALAAEPSRLETDRSSREPRYAFSTRWGKTTMGLAGPRGAENATLALTLFERLGFDPRPHLDSLSKINWPGRMQRLSKTPCPTFFSGDHNPQGVHSLLELLSDYRRDKIHLVVGIGKEKSADEMLGLFSKIPRSSIYLTTPSFKGRRQEDYGTWPALCEGFWPNPMTALSNARKRATSNDLILITGSLYLYSSIANDVAGDLAFIAPRDRRLENETAELPVRVDDGHARSALQ